MAVLVWEAIVSTMVLRRWAALQHGLRYSKSRSLMGAVGRSQLSVLAASQGLSAVAVMLLVSHWGLISEGDMHAQSRKLSNIAEVPGRALAAPQSTLTTGQAPVGQYCHWLSDRGQATLWLTVVTAVYGGCTLHSPGRTRDWDCSRGPDWRGASVLLSSSVREFSTMRRQPPVLFSPV